MCYFGKLNFESRVPKIIFIFYLLQSLCNVIDK